MNPKFIALGTTGAATLTAVSLGISYLAGAFDDVTFVPTGKTLKERYPKIKVPEYQNGPYGEKVNNSFWLGKAKKLNEKYSPVKPVWWNSFYESVKASKEPGKYNFQDDNFNLDPSKKTFLIGDSHIAEILAKYCIYISDKEEPKMENYFDILKDLCT